MPVLRHLDLVVLVLALPIFLLADWPMLGYAAGAAAWLLQRGLQHWTNAKASSSEDVRKSVGILAGSMIGRGWLVAIVIFATGILADDSDGLAAAILVVVLFTVYFTVGMILRPFQSNPRELPS